MMCQRIVLCRKPSFRKAQLLPTSTLMQIIVLHSVLAVAVFRLFHILHILLVLPATFTKKFSLRATVRLVFRTNSLLSGNRHSLANISSFSFLFCWFAVFRESVITWPVPKLINHSITSIFCWKTARTRGRPRIFCFSSKTKFLGPSSRFVLLNKHSYAFLPLDGSSSRASLRACFYFVVTHNFLLKICATPPRAVALRLAPK